MQNEAGLVGIDTSYPLTNEILFRIIKTSIKKTHGTWDNRCREFSNKETPRHIWDSVWGWVGEFNGNRYAAANAEAACLAVNYAEQMARELLRIRGIQIPPHVESSDELLPAESGL